MRRTAAGIAVSLLAALAIGGPLAGTGGAAATTLRCGAGTTTPEACSLLDDLAAQLASVSPLLGDGLAPLTSSAQGLAARSDGPDGVPTADVTSVSTALLGQLGQLPRSVQVLLGATKLGDLTSTLEALVAELAAPAAGGQKATGTAKPTPAATSGATPATTRATEVSSLGGSASTGRSSAETSTAAVPDVPVGDPLTLAPLALPDFGFNESFTPVEVAEVAPATDVDAALAQAADALPNSGSGAELAVVVVLSLLLMAGAGIAQLQQNRRTIPD